eukprot:4566172-Pyramimonas_sp.AAC.1
MQKALRNLGGVKCPARARRYSRAPGYLHECRPIPPQSMHWLSAFPASGYPGACGPARHHGGGILDLQ